MDTRKSQDRINELLQEIRIVLPGTQALLGFQFVAFFNNSFQDLSAGLQGYHLFNLILTTFSTILLITPVAYHELADDGRNTEELLKFTSRLITAAMLCLLASLSGDVFVAANLLRTIPNVAPWLAAGTTLIFGVTMWFVLSLLRRNRT